MADEKHNFHLLLSLVHDISSDILVRFLDKKLEIASLCLPTFLQAERHTFYHLLEGNECCACSAYTTTDKIFMYKKQWNDLYSSNRQPCGKRRNCSCRYDVQANVRSSALDISLCSILLLNSSILNINRSESIHICRIRKLRNDLAHNTSSEINNSSFQAIWNDVVVSIIQLARTCSSELAVQTEEKINLAKTPQQSLHEMVMICEEYPKCVTSLELENERSLKVCTSVGAVQGAVERMNECFTPMPQQMASYDITKIRGRLLNDEYKEYIMSYLDANLVIEVLRKTGLFSNSDAQRLFCFEGMRTRSEKMLQKILSKHDTVVDGFMHSLLETQQSVIHNFIQGTDCRSKLCMTIECDIPQPHPVGVDLSLHITLKDRPNLQSKILQILREEEDEINRLTMMFAKMSLRDVEEGSIIVRLKPEDPDAVETFYNAFINGQIRELIEEILRRSGVLDELIRDQVTVVVKISTDETNREPFYERNWKFLVEELSPRSVAALLQERGVLTDNDIKEIFHADNLTRFSQTNSLIHKLNLKYNETLIDFKQCLSLTSQSYILSNIKDSKTANENRVEQASQTENHLSTDRRSNGDIRPQGNLRAPSPAFYGDVTSTVPDDTEDDDISTIAKTYSVTCIGDDGINELSELGATDAGPFIDMRTDFNQEILNAVGSEIQRELGLNETISLPMNIIDDNMSIVNINAHPSGLEESDSDEEASVGPDFNQEILKAADSDIQKERELKENYSVPMDITDDDMSIGYYKAHTSGPDESDSDEEEIVGPIKLKETLKLRDYQKELADPAVKGHNCVIVAPTGSGKTHVALEIIKEHMKRMWGRRVAKIAFFVEQTALATQQGQMCKKYLNHKVKIITGEIQRHERLSEWMSRNDILVVTAQLLVNAIAANDVDITQFSLLVFDECHHTNSNHSFNKIMHFYLDQKHSGNDVDLPQIVGMTASLGVGGANTKETTVKWVEKILAHLDAEVLATVKINQGQLADHALVADQKSITYEPRTNNLFERLVAQLMTFIEEYMVKNKYARYLPDTSILKSPARYGSEQYTLWVICLWKETSKVSNQEARRFFTCCRRYLECYNNAMVIYYNARVKDALTYIEQEVKAMNDSIIPDETDSKMKTLYEKSKPSLERHVQGNNNENPKLEILKGALMQAVEENPDLRCIVFVKTRELGKALEAWMKETTELKELRATTFFGGGMTKHQQHDTLNYFWSGKHKVIVATSVAEEGLDITKCNLVIKYQHVTSKIWMMQSRGRGRAEGMMLQAIDIIQEKIQRNKMGFLKNMSDIQKSEKSERKLEAANRQQKATQDGQFSLRCHICSKFICMSTDVKKIMDVHHVHHAVFPEDIGDLVSVKKLPEAKFPVQITCKNCGWYLGYMSLYFNAQFPILKVANLLIVDRHGSQTAVKKWKQVPFTVHPLSNADLQKRITSTFKLLAK